MTGSSVPATTRKTPPPVARRRGAPLVALVAVTVLSACAVGPERNVVQLHAAYGTADAIVVEGRVLEDVHAPTKAGVDDRSSVNLRRNAALFTAEACDECTLDVRLGLADPVSTSTDDDGFFRVELAPSGAEADDGESSASAAPADGWQPVIATGQESDRLGDALIVPPGNRLGIVSDIDDTVMITEVGDRYRMLGNTFFRNPLQRDAVEGMAALYERVLAVNPRPEAAPLFYLSSSPRQLNGYIEAFLERNELPRGVLITRRLTFDREGLAQLDSVAYKTARLVDILERLPDVTFVLVGDDGENDPRIYEGVRERFPGRIAAIWIRRANPLGERAPLPAGQEEVADVIAGRVPLPTLADEAR